MKEIRLWDEGISSDQRIIADADDVPFNGVMLSHANSQPTPLPGTLMRLISGWVGLASYRKRPPEANR